MTLPGRKRRKLSDELAEPLDSGASFVAAEVPEVPTITKQSWWSLVAENIRVFSLPLLRSIFRVRFIGLGCGLVIVVLSALAVVYSTHWSRQLFSELKGLQLHRDQLEREWSQLLLEQSAWSTHNRIERIAMEQLNMVMPDMDKVEVVR
ncbi:MAG: cell division protein FtsL [Hahellaceae bacterium]|nr:cell division protein FtsL [Hahellaceae bacterium]MCP5169848.1 cell division protein FtsL [Hahellaceae bacterium]